MGKSKTLLIGTIMAFSLSPLFGDFVRIDAKEVVKDTTNSLMWQDDVDEKTTVKNWIEAQQYCTDSSFVGYSDWFLPDRYQLESLIDKANSPAIQTAFKNTVSERYWSSTAYAADTSYAWYVSFGVGVVNSSAKKNYYNVRCVRKDTNTTIPLDEYTKNNKTF